MKCSVLGRWLEDNPGQDVPDVLRAHAAGCSDCRRLMEEQAALERALWSLPAAEPPAFFETRLKAAVLGERKRLPAWRLLLAPMAAILVLAAAAALFVFRRSSNIEPVSFIPKNAEAPNSPVEAPPMSPEPLASGRTVIYPVWPSDGDVVAGDDVSIMASLYPAPPPGTVISMKINDRDVSGRVHAEGELLSYDPGRMEPGRHVVTITLREAGGGERSLTFSFFALEARS